MRALVTDSACQILASCETEDEMDDWIQAFVGMGAKVSERASGETFARATTLSDFSCEDLFGNTVSFDRFRGQVVAVVNVTSTSPLAALNFFQLQSLYDKYAAQGLVVLAFPCRQFCSRTAETNADITAFIAELGVKFPVLGKIAVNGMRAHPLFTFLRSRLKSACGNFIPGNFTVCCINEPCVTDFHAEISHRP